MCFVCVHVCIYIHTRTHTHKAHSSYSHTKNNLHSVSIWRRANAKCLGNVALTAFKSPQVYFKLINKIRRFPSQFLENVAFVSTYLREKMCFTWTGGSH